MQFIYNEYSCEEKLQETGFDIEEVKKYLCQAQIEKLEADLYVANEKSNYYEFANDDKAQYIDRLEKFLEEIKNDLLEDSITKVELANKIREFLC